MKGFYLAVICISLFACSQEHVSLEGLQSYIADEDNGLQKSIEVDGTQITVTYRPSDLIVDQEIGGEQVDKETLLSIQRRYSSSFYFVVSLAKEHKDIMQQVADKVDYGELVQTLSFHMPAYTFLTTSKIDTIAVDDFALNRSFGLSNSTDLLFVFSRNDVKTDDDWVEFNLNEFGLGVGNQRFRFRLSDIANAPQLKFETQE